MMWIGTAGIPSSTKGGYVEAINDLVEMGLNAIEVEFVYGVRMKQEYAREMGEKKPKGFEITIHAPYYINLLNPEKQDASIKRIMDSLRRGNEMGAYSVAVHTGFYGKLGKEEAMETVDGAIGRIEDLMKEEGIRTLLGLETTGKQSQFGTVDEIAELMKTHRRVIPVIDFAHLHARMQGNVDFLEELKKVKRIKKLHAHFSGIEFGEKGEKRHLPISSNSPDFREVLKALKRDGRDVIMICESPLLERDAVEMARIARKEGFDIPVPGKQ